MCSFDLCFRPRIMTFLEKFSFQLHVDFCGRRMCITVEAGFSVSLVLKTLKITAFFLNVVEADFVSYSSSVVIRICSICSFQFFWQLTLASEYNDKDNCECCEYVQVLRVFRIFRSE